MFELALVLAGSMIATAAMAIGIGGGILWTPLLILVYQLTPADAISTSLFIQVAGLGSGTLA
ncbi:MAG: sulfite exporter TauE/SafE family protein, partial [Gammaproteobacteria bacterium]|nr:sulfite exporter TauE/SafE family protein [Gammaproteobacteria bacterium]